MGGVCKSKVAGWAHTSLAMGKGGEAAPSKSIGVAEAEGTGMGGVSGQGADHASRHQMGGKLPEHKKKMADAKAAARHEKAAQAMRVRLKESHHGPHAMGERDRHDRSRQTKKQPRQKQPR